VFAARQRATYRGGFSTVVNDAGYPKSKRRGRFFGHLVELAYRPYHATSP